MRVLVIAPHPDDETLGCGGTLLRHAHAGDEINWLIATTMTSCQGYDMTQQQRRQLEIQQVSAAFGFEEVIQLEHPAAQLDQVPLSALVQEFNEVIHHIDPLVVYLPFPGDAHTDHQVVFKAASSCLKGFRQPQIQKIYCYEALSETDASLDPFNTKFHPTVFLDIRDYLDRKIEIMKIYQSEWADFPFPRSEQALRALAQVRGAAVGMHAAESFVLLQERR